MARPRRKSWYSRRGYYSDFLEYVSVAEKRARASEEVARRSKKGEKLQPITIEGRLIARSAWGRGWCEHIEKFHDYFNRLERGRSYARNGSIIHLEIAAGGVRALVSGSSVYDVHIGIAPLAERRWQQIVNKCSGAIASWLDLLAGRFSEGIMAILADPDHGLFPGKGDVKLQCSCPDGAIMCKHVAAVLYGVGARLDAEPEMLFKLRQVDASHLLAATMRSDSLTGAAGDGGNLLSESEDESFADLFGIELDTKPAKKEKKLKPEALERPVKSAKSEAKPKRKSVSVISIEAKPVESVKRRRGRPPKITIQQVCSPKPVSKRKRGRPAGGMSEIFPVVSAAELLAMGFSRADINRMLRQSVLKPHARGKYQTTMPLADYRSMAARGENSI